MPYQGASFRRQKALLWEPTGTGPDGRPTVSTHDPEEIYVRWVRKLYDGKDSRDTTYAFDAVVVTDRDIPEGSLLWEGSLEDWLSAGSGGQDEDYLEVVRVSRTPDLKGRFYRHTLGLSRYQGALPGLEGV